LRLDVDVDPATAGALVPMMILQPLVENAVQHAVQTRQESGIDGDLSDDAWRNAAVLDHFYESARRGRQR
jgi:hypothetical protein